MSDIIIYGTYPLSGIQLDSAIGNATSVGYRWFDTAQIYGNEADLGAALRHTAMPRDDFKVTTKIAPPNYDGRAFLPSLRNSLAALQLDDVDLLLLHFPPSAGQLAATLDLLAEAKEMGLAREVGISNFTPEMMRRAATISPVELSVNQVEFHPLVDGRKLLAASAQTDIPLQAFSPLARGAVFSQPVLAEIARAHGRPVAQVVFRWILQHGVSPVTQSAKPANIASNFESTGFTLSAEEMDRIDALARVNHRIINSSVIPWAPVWE